MVHSLKFINLHIFIQFSFWMHFIFAGEASTDPSRSLNLSSGWYLVGIEGVFCKLLRSLMFSVSSGFGRYPSVSASSFDWLNLARRADFIPTAFCVYWWGFSAQKLPHCRSKTQPISLTKYGNHTGFPVFSRISIGIVDWHNIWIFFSEGFMVIEKMGILVSRFRPRFSPHILYYLDQHGKVLGYRLSVRFFKEKYAKWCNGKLRSGWKIFFRLSRTGQISVFAQTEVRKKRPMTLFHWNKKKRYFLCPQLTQEECPP